MYCEASDYIILLWEINSILFQMNINYVSVNPIM